jgi:CubicO group peptidase (beta-lactamase class C family)
MKDFVYTSTIILLLICCDGKKTHEEEAELNTSKNEIPTANALEMGIDTLLLSNLRDSLRNQVYPNIHSVLIAKNGKLFFEEYFNGTDQIYGRDIGLVEHSDTTLHDQRSISKSIVSALIGIAIEKGQIRNVDQNISEFFPEYDSLFIGDKSLWTIGHFLSMTSGMIWNEEVSYNEPENDEIKMTYSEDPIPYILSKPMEAVPGTKFNYSGGNTQILAEIIEITSNKPLDEFAKLYLFDPIGIDRFEWNKFSVWNKESKGDNFAAPSGLRLTSRDMMRIGLLYRNQGKWNDIQVLPKKWVDESFKKRIEYPSTVWEGNDAYGYQFWMWPDVVIGKDIWIIAAQGNGDQEIYWDLNNDLIVVTTAGNYNLGDAIKKDSEAMLKESIYPAIGNIK